MLRAGDRVLVCLSGGKDSLSLLHVLRQYRFVAASRGADFELAAVTVDPQSSQYDPRPLIPYLKKLGVTYYYEVQGERERERGGGQREQSVRPPAAHTLPGKRLGVTYYYEVQGESEQGMFDYGRSE